MLKHSNIYVDLMIINSFHYLDYPRNF